MSTLTRSEQAVYEYVKVLAGSTGFCRPSNEKIIRTTCVSRKTVNSAFTKMQARGDGFHDWRVCSSHNKQTATWHFFGSDAWFYWIVTEHRKHERELHWLGEYQPIHHDSRHLSNRDKTLTTSEMNAVLRQHPELETMAELIQENTF